MYALKKALTPHCLKRPFEMIDKKNFQLKEIDYDVTNRKYIFFSLLRLAESILFLPISYFQKQ
jgi:hypothetical protein